MVSLNADSERFLELVKDGRQPTRQEQEELWALVEQCSEARAEARREANMWSDANAPFAQAYCVERVLSGAAFANEYIDRSN